MGMQVSGLNNLSLGKASPWVPLRTADGAIRYSPFSPSVKLGSILVDALVALIGWSLVFAGRSLSQPGGPWMHWFSGHDALFVLVSLGILVLSCNANGLYDGLRRRPTANEAFPIIRAQILAAIILIIIAHISGATVASPWIIAATSIINIGMFVAWRAGYHFFVLRRSEPGYGGRNVLVMGADKIGCAISRYMNSHKDSYHFIGFLDSNADSPEVLGDPGDFADIARMHFIDVLFITPQPDRELVKAITDEARRLNVSVKMIPDDLDGLAWNSPIESLGDFPVRAVYRPPIQHAALSVKRAMDVFVSAAALLILLPVFLVVAIIIHLDSPGPILYRGERVGRKGRKFLCYKFRTMIANADALKDQFRHLNERQGLLFKIREDPRTTRAGRFLRKYSLDELPQLWNVLKGDMSLVGPRPPLKSEVEMYSLEHLRRLNVTPGITGLWQVTARQDPSFDTYFALDLEYIESWSPLLDMKLLFKTIPAVLKGTGQ